MRAKGLRFQGTNTSKACRHERQDMLKVMVTLCCALHLFRCGKVLSVGHARHLEGCKGPPEPPTEEEVAAQVRGAGLHRWRGVLGCTGWLLRGCRGVGVGCTGGLRGVQGCTGGLLRCLFGYSSCCKTWSFGCQTIDWGVQGCAGGLLRGVQGCTGRGRCRDAGMRSSEFCLQICCIWLQPLPLTVAAAAAARRRPTEPPRRTS